MFCPNLKILCYISVLNKNNFTAFFLKTTFIKVNKKLQSTAGNFEVALGCSFILKIEEASHQRQRFRTQWLTTMEVTSRTLGESPLLSVGVLFFFVFFRRSGCRWWRSLPAGRCGWSPGWAAGSGRKVCRRSVEGLRKENIDIETRF